ncbi:TetR/AcrR family transcriptional regulator [Ekhidna sp. To15]|uniref:TetR/AcrR family transcriptional regulator n=1 Tax=Ekhidna sp. To15 TaxID=3395267 RepID=UPI003F51EA7F
MNKKQQVIKAATSLFSEKGFEKTSMSEICIAANVSKGLVYHHFQSKNEILENIFSDTTEQMKNVSSAADNESPSNQLLLIIENFFSQLEKDAVILRLNLNVMFQPSTREFLQTQIKERSAILFASVKKIFDQIDGQKSKTLSFMFIAELDGIALSYLSVFDDYPLQEIKEQLLSKYKSL